MQMCHSLKIEPQSFTSSSLSQVQFVKENNAREIIFSNIFLELNYFIAFFHYFLNLHN